MPKKRETGLNGTMSIYHKNIDPFIAFDTLKKRSRFLKEDMIINDYKCGVKNHIPLLPK